MADCVMTMKSVTYAEKAKKAAVALGIKAEIASIDPTVTKRGCAFGLTFPCGEAKRLTQALIKRGIPHGEILGHGQYV